MALAHVGAPEEIGVAEVEIVVVAHRLVGTEGLHEGGHGAGHAEAGVGVDAVAADAGLHELGGDITLLDGPLAGAEHADLGRAVLLDGFFQLTGDPVVGFVPGDLDKLVALAQQRPGQTVRAGKNLGQEVALDAVEPLVDRRLGVALGGYDLAVAASDENPATGAAEAAGGLAPGQPGIGRLGVTGQQRVDRQPGGGQSRGGRGALDKTSPFDIHTFPPFLL